MSYIPVEQKLQPPIGIFGGTFDPIHNGHLRPGLEICEQLKLDHIRYIPSYTPPHRDNPATDVQLRTAMVKAAIAGETRFCFDAREIDRQGYSYMIDTLRTLREDFPLSPICLLMGMDAFMKIHTWYQWEILLDNCHIVVLKRPDSDFGERIVWPKEIKKWVHLRQTDELFDLHDHLYGKIIFQSVTQLAISSSDIRARLKQNGSIRYLVPDSVLDLINKHRLYL